MARLALITALAALALTTPAAAQDVPVPADGWTVVQDEQAVNGADDAMTGAYADAQNSRIVTASPLTRRELAHEVGHLVDWQYLTDTDRERAARIMGVRAWDYTDNKPMTGAEWFADYYAAAATDYNPAVRHLKGGGLRGGQDFTYAHITGKRLRDFQWFLLGLAARDGLRTGRV